MISLLIPSRNRHARLKHLMQNIMSTAQHKHKLELVIMLDNDESSTNIRDLLWEFRELRMVWIVGERPKFLTDTYNFMITRASGEILMYASDDIEFEGPNWDARVHAEFDKIPDNIGLMSLNEPMAMHGFVGKKGVDLMGFLFPPMSHGYCDQWITAIYQQLNRFVVIADHTTKHNHWHANPGQRDETYEFREARDITGLTPDEKDAIRFDALKPFKTLFADKLMMGILGHMKANDSKP